MVTLKVNPVGDGTDGLTWATAYTTIASAVAVANTNDIIEISGGAIGLTYPECIVTTCACTLQGSSEAGHNGCVVIDGGGLGDHCVTFSYDLTLRNLHVTGADAGKQNIRAIANLRMYDVTSRDGDSLLYIASTVSSVKGSRVVFYGGVVDGVATGGYTTGSTDITFDYFVLRDCVNTEGFALRHANSLTLNNGLIANMLGGYGLEANRGGATVTLNNIIMFGNRYQAVRKQDLFTGTITANNCIFIKGTQAGAYEEVDVKNNCTNIESPNFTDSRRESISTIYIDDVGSIDFFFELADYAKEKGYNAVFALCHPQNLTPEQWEGLRTRVAQGHEVAAHSVNHPYLNVSEFVQVTCNVTSATLEVSTDTTAVEPDNWTGTLVCKEGGSTVLSLDLHSNDADYINEIVTSINALSGWTCTAPITVRYARSTVLANDVYSVGSTASSLLCSDEAYWYSEIVWAKKIIEDNLEAPVVSWAFPGNAVNADLLLYIRNDTSIYPGHFAKAGTTPFKIARTNNSGDRDLSSFDLYNIYTIHMESRLGVMGTDADSLQEKAVIYGMEMAHRGLLEARYSHYHDWALQDWYDYIDTIKTLGGCKLMTMAEIHRYVTESGLWIDIGDDVWERTYADTWDCKIKQQGYADRGGIPVGGLHDQTELAKDIFGSDVYFPASIGAHEPAKRDLVITEDDYTPIGWTIRKGAAVIVRGGGHVDMSGLSDADGEITVKLDGTISQFTPKAGVTVLECAGGDTPQLLIGGGVLAGATYI